MKHILNDNQLVVDYCRHRSKREVVIKAILLDKEFLQKIKLYILSNQGTVNDYEDLLNDGIIAFIKMCIKPNFNLSTNVKSYLFGIIKNLWYSKCRREGIKSKILDKPSMNPQNTTEPSVEDILIKKERKVILSKLLEELGSKCKDILTMWSYNLKMSEISETLGLASVEATRKAKHDCLKRINKILSANPSLATKLK